MLDIDVTREEIISAATPFVARAEAEAAAEAAEAAAEAGDAAAARAAAERRGRRDDLPRFDFDEAFAVDAALAVEGVADVEAAVEIEHILEAAQGKTPEKVEKWLEQNLAEALVEEANGDQLARGAADDATPRLRSAAEIDRGAPLRVRGSRRDGPRALARDGDHQGARRVRRRAPSRRRPLRSRRRADPPRAGRRRRRAAPRAPERADFEKTAARRRQARPRRRASVAAAAGAEVAAAAAAAAAATVDELQEERQQARAAVELKIVVAEPSPPAAEVPVEVRSPAKAGECDSEAGCDSEACKVCGVADERDALLCDGCDGAFHMGCLKPPRKRVPAGDWFCKPCAAERKPAPKRRRRRPRARAAPRARGDDETFRAG